MENSLCLRMEKTLERKESCMFWVNTILKLPIQLPFTQAIHYKLYKELLDPKSCELSTLVESGMPKKSVESYTFTIKRFPFPYSSYNFI